MEKKFSHEIAYRGEGLLEKLSNFQITICGAGALGSNLADMLARQGVVNMRIIDNDRVETHNIGTQIYSENHDGMKKVAALKQIIYGVSGIEIDENDKRLDRSNSRKLLTRTNLVVDAFDNTESRGIVQETCTNALIPCLHAGMIEDYGEVVWGSVYNLPKESPGARDVCDYPLSRNLVMMTTTVLAEEIMDFAIADKPRLNSWSITLKDLCIKPYR